MMHSHRLAFTFFFTQIPSEATQCDYSLVVYSVNILDNCKSKVLRLLVCVCVRMCVADTVLLTYHVLPGNAGCAHPQK